MKSVHVAIEGTSALLMNRFTQEAQDRASSGTSLRHEERDEPAEDAAARLYTTGQNGDRRPYVPAEWLRQSLVGGAGFHKVGRRAASTHAAAGILIAPEIVVVEPGEWVVDSRPVTIPATKGRIVRHRPRFDTWVLKFEIQYDDEILDETLVRKIVDAAGSKVGIGDYRPARKGPYGRFVVINWDRA